MTIADFFTLIKEADLGPIDRIMVPVAPNAPTPTKAESHLPEKATTP